MAGVEGLGSVPWDLGGDWNLEPREVGDQRSRREASLYDLGIATHRLGGTLIGCLVASGFRW